MQSDMTMYCCTVNISPIFYYLKAEKEELKMSPSVIVSLGQDAKMFISSGC